jgi:hypothetical protein
VIYIYRVAYLVKRGVFFRHIAFLDRHIFVFCVDFGKIIEYLLPTNRQQLFHLLQNLENLLHGFVVEQSQIVGNEDL